MKKRIIVAALAACLTLSFAACGDGTTQGGSEDANVTGEVVEVGDFTVLLPEGWYGFNQTDVFGEKDADGNYPIRTDAYGMIKDGTSELDAFSNPCVYIYSFETDAQTQADSSLWFYDETEEIELTVNGTECLAYHVSSDYSDDGTDVYEYDLVFIPMGDSKCIQVQSLTKSSDIEGVGVNDPDVIAIMESIKMN